MLPSPRGLDLQAGFEFQYLYLPTQPQHNRVLRCCRLKATLERLQRLTEAYSEELLELLPPVANALGAALGVAQHAITTFTEAEIRANVVFQVRQEDEGQGWREAQGLLEHCVGAVLGVRAAAVSGSDGAKTRPRFVCTFDS